MTNTLKRIFSLVLVVATMMTLCVVHVSAAYTALYVKICSNDGTVVFKTFSNMDGQGSVLVPEFAVNVDGISYVGQSNYYEYDGKGEMEFLGLSDVPNATEAKYPVGSTFSVTGSAGEQTTVNYYVVEQEKHGIITGDAVPNATSYVLCSKTDSGYTELATSDTLHFDLAALNLPNGSYTLVVKAKADGYDDSDYSNEIEWTNEIFYTVTSNITNGTLGGVGGGETPVKAASGSTLSAQIVPNEGCVLPDSITVKMGDETLTSGYTYNAETGAITVENVTANVTIMAAAITKPNAPTLILGGEKNNKYPNGAVVSWTSVAGATGYKGYVGGECVIESSDPSITSYDLSEMELPAGTYSLYVTAVNKAGESVSSNTVSFVIADVQLLTKPVLTNKSTASQCIFSFTNDTNAEYYVFYANGELIPSVAWTPALVDGVYTITIAESYFSKDQTVEITAKAVAEDGTAFMDSELSDALTFTKTKEKLATPVIKLS